MPYPKPIPTRRRGLTALVVAALAAASLAVPATADDHIKRFATFETFTNPSSDHRLVWVDLAIPVE